LTTQDVANYLESIVDTARNKEFATILASTMHSLQPKCMMEMKNLSLRTSNSQSIHFP
jgi:hypothetical protein